MNLDLAGAFAARRAISALACVDGDAGIVLGVDDPDEASKDAVEIAEDEGDHGREAFVTSGSSVHAFVRVPTRPDLLVVALARGDTNVADLRAWLRAIAARVGVGPK